MNIDQLRKETRHAVIERVDGQRYFLFPTLSSEEFKQIEKLPFLPTGFSVLHIAENDVDKIELLKKLPMREYRTHWVIERVKMFSKNKTPRSRLTGEFC